MITVLFAVLFALFLVGASWGLGNLIFHFSSQGQNLLFFTYYVDRVNPKRPDYVSNFGHNQTTIKRSVAKKEIKEAIKIINEDFWLLLDTEKCPDIRSIYINGFDTKEYTLIEILLAYTKYVNRYSSLIYHEDIFEEEFLIEAVINSDTHTLSDNDMFNDYLLFTSRTSSINFVFDQCIGDYLRVSKRIGKRTERKLEEAISSVLEDIKMLSESGPAS